MIRRQSDNLGQQQAARFSRLDSLRRRQPQMRLWPARSAQHNHFLARALMPINNCKMIIRLQRLAHGAGQTGPIWNAVKGICREYEISRAGANLPSS
jgi:hypothetical protein